MKLYNFYNQNFCHKLTNLRRHLVLFYTLCVPILAGKSYNYTTGYVWMLGR